MPPPRRKKSGPRDLPFDLKTLQVYEAVCNTGSMTEAARRFRMTQPAVSHTIGTLESSLGVRLVDRKLRPLGVTPAGAALRRRAERILEEAFQTIPAVLRSARTKLPHVRIGLVHSLAASLGPPLLRSLSEAVAHTTILSDLAPGLSEALLRRQIDIVVSADDLQDVDGIERHPLLVEPFIVVVPRGHEALTRSGLAALARDLPFLRYSGRSQTGLMIERHIRRLGLDVARYMEFDLSSVLLGAVGEGHGWALTTPICLHEARVGSDHLVPVRLPAPGLTRRITLVAHRGEVGDLPRILAERARRVMETRLLPEIRSLIPWLGNAIEIEARTP
jgi:DNA-binding transcriptional LysR family regulator